MFLSIVSNKEVQGLFLVLTLTLLAAPGFAENQDKSKAATIEFKKDSMIEIAYLTIKKGKEKELNDRYFTNVMPIAQEYGLKPLGKFKINSTEYGPDNAEMIALFQWPSLEAKEKFDKDPRFQKLKPIRDSMLDHLKLVFLTVDQDTTVNIKDSNNAMYEFAALWINKKNAPKLDEYFTQIGPLIEKYNIQFPAVFNVIGSTSDEYNLEPNVIFMVEWPNGEVKDKVFTSEEFKKAGYLRALALDQLYIVEAEYIYQ